VRRQAPEELEIHASGRHASDGRLRLWIDQGWLGAVEVRRIEPEPERTESQPGRLIYVFNAAANGTAAIHLQFEADEWGAVPARLGLVGGPELSLTQFVYP